MFEHLWSEDKMLIEELDLTKQWLGSCSTSNSFTVNLWHGSRWHALFKDYFLIIRLHAHKTKRLQTNILRKCFYEPESGSWICRKLDQDGFRGNLVTPPQSGFWNGQTRSPPLGLVCVCILPWSSGNQAHPRRAPTGSPRHWQVCPQGQTGSRWTWERRKDQNLRGRTAWFGSSKLLLKCGEMCFGVIFLSFRPSPHWMGLNFSPNLNEKLVMTHICRVSGFCPVSDCFLMLPFQLSFSLLVFSPCITCV